MHGSTYTPPRPNLFGLNDAVDFLNDLDYDTSGLGNAEIFQLLDEVMDGLKENEEDMV
jgi:2',3'-cyclic-nucleotide 2'-phosphodiesterase (5'-nucleotidase family)